MNSSITAIIITLNEESVIRDCLVSAKQVADEVIVLDSGSTDGTEKICREQNVRFVSVEWKGYAQTKNHGHSLASNDYILSLDADERLDEQAVNNVLERKSQGLQGAYSLNRKNFFGEKWIRYCGWYPDAKVRLFHRNNAQWKGDFVHEELVVDDEVTHLTGNILHLTVKDSEDQMKTVRKYAQLAAQKNLSSGRSLNPIGAIGSATGRFIKIFLLKLGFLHGITGFIIALNSARSKWLRYKYFTALRK